MRTFIGGSLDLGTDRVDQPRPMLEVAFDERAELRRRKLDPLEAVRLEEFARLRQVERLGYVPVDLVDQLRRRIGWPPHREPDRGLESGHAGLRDGRELGAPAQPLRG